MPPMYIVTIHLRTLDERLEWSLWSEDKLAELRADIKRQEFGDAEIVGVERLEQAA